MKMWHEARKQEKKIKGLIVDYRRRAERRQDFYEKIKADPTQFMQIHGRTCKIHLDPAIAAAGDGSAIIVPWQGQQDNLIDRFDVRAHLDYIPAVPKVKELEDISGEERQCNYERYRILAQNDFLGISEEKFLHQLYLEEQFGANAQIEADRNASKKKPSGGAAIGYIYEDSDATPFSHILSLPTSSAAAPVDAEDSDSDDVDMDVSIDVSKLDTSQAHELNGCGRNYGMKSNDFYSFLTKDADEADALRLAREEEQEKIMLSGRKSRRERRAQRERRFAGRPLSPPSYAAKEEPPVSSNVNENDSDSRSPSPENSGKITYITSFGGEDELQPHSKISINLSKPQKSFGAGNSIGPQYMGQTVTYAEKVKENLEKLRKMNEINKKASSNSPKKPRQYMRSQSSSRSRTRSRSPRYRHRRSRTRSREYRGRRERHRSRSRSHSRKRRYTRSRSCSRSRSFRRRNHSRSYSPKYRSRYRRSSSSSSSSSSDVRTEVIKQAVEKSSSRSKSQSQDTIRKSRSKSKTICLPIPVATSLVTEPIVQEPPEIPIKRYYGRKRDNESSSEEDLLGNQDDEPDTSNSDRSNPVPVAVVPTTNIMGKATTSTPATSFSASEIKANNSGAPAKTTNLREKLKRKMQMLLNKQYKADKKAEIERTERQIQQQQEREDEMRELALKLRRRQRELRHKYGTPTSSPSKSSRNSDEEKDDGEPSDEVKTAQICPESYTKSPSKTREIRDRDERSSSNRSRSRSRRSQSRRKSPVRNNSRWSRSRSRGRRSNSRRRDHRSRDRNYGKDRDHDRNYRSSRRSPDRGDRHRDRYARDRSGEDFRHRDRYREKERDRRDRKRERNNGKNRHDYSPKIARKLVDY